MMSMKALRMKVRIDNSEMHHIVIGVSYRLYIQSFLVL
jgi:hypothetical protein